MTDRRYDITFFHIKLFFIDRVVSYLISYVISNIGFFFGMSHR